MPVDVDVDKVAQYAIASRESYERDLKKLVDIPGVSMDPDRKIDITRTAEAAAQLLKDAGAKAEIIQTKGNPVVFAEMIADPSYPTVTIYNHMDVQPADPEEWKTAPFDMKIEDGTYRGRGSTDDKGPALAVLYAAKYAYEQKVPINIKFIWELEEEIGSPNFEQFLRENKAKLGTDSIVVSDTIWVSRDKPAIPYGLRGLQGVLVRLKTGVKDVHSGTTGGLARNPIGELAQLINECYDAKTGHVNIPGFYDAVAKPSESEADNFVASGFDVKAFMKAHELLSLRTMDAKEASQRIWALPTFEVHGITGGYNGPGVKTIVPHEAEAKISMRLVPGQDPDKILQAFTRFVQEKCPDATVVPEGSLRPYLGEFTGPFNNAASAAMKAGFGKEAAFTREGGSIGAVVSMHDILNKPIVFLGLSLPEHGYHAINENFDWQQAGGGIKMFVQYFNALSKIKQ
ncbi:MAG: M20/M25/M40 family metallo-hydrolase [Candidatus Melainabacteria bacterium]|nr:M20/M25/M40 family metallo-hydrolase [Candidatus Melainabacteria bacterium]